MSKKLFSMLAVGLLAAGSLGCAMCEDCQDYGGAYYGGVYGLKPLMHGRWNSEFSGHGGPGGPVHHAGPGEEVIVEGEAIDDGAMMDEGPYYSPIE